MIFALAMALGCSGSESLDRTDSAVADVAADVPTWHQDVAPIVARSCDGCHQAGVAGAVTWESDAEIQAWAPSMAAEVAAGRMPPWQAKRDCNSYEGDFSLSDEERALIVAWGEGGAPLGEALEAAALPQPFQADELERRDLELFMPSAYQPRSDQADDYRCFLLEWPYDEKVWVTGYEMLPDSDAVHHIIPFRIDPEDVEFYRALDAEDPAEGYTCYGGPGGELQQVARLGWLGAWAPGVNATTLPEGTGIPIKPGSLIAFQVHYNIEHLEDAPTPDSSGLAFQISTESVEWADIQPWTDVAWVAGVGMDIPAETSGVEHEFSYTVPDDTSFRFHSALVHMHQLGRTGRMWIEHANGDETCLLDYTEYDFNWQRDYRLTEPVEVAGGDTVHLRCRWDNETADDVQWGDGTGDEMCLGVTLLTR